MLGIDPKAARVAWTVFLLALLLATAYAVRETLAPVGLLDVKVAMLDDDWSGLKFMWRLERRAARR